MKCALPGDTSIVCSHPKCGYSWWYSGRRKRATCPMCGRQIDVIDNQHGMYLSLHEMLDINRFNNDVRELLVVALKSGDKESIDGIRAEFPLKE